MTRLLGQGGMGEVWAARDKSLRREVAVKLLRLDPGMSSALPKRFEREAVAAAQINHRNVVALYDRGRHGDLLYLVMERVEGRDLAGVVRERGPLHPAHAVAVARQVCDALAAAHDAGVVHYDIKPQNIMMTPGGVAKVVDFGVAGFVDAVYSVALSSELSPAGTPAYAAPEQFDDERGDARSDLYALGGVLFAMLAGRPPFTGQSPLVLLRAKVEHPAPRLDTVRPGLPDALVGLVADLLEREPAARPQTARQVADRLAACEADVAAAVVAGAVGHPAMGPATSGVPADALPTQPQPTEPVPAWPVEGSPARRGTGRVRRRTVLVAGVGAVAAAAGVPAWWAMSSSNKGDKDDKGGASAPGPGSPSPSGAARVPSAPPPVALARPSSFNADFEVACFTIGPTGLVTVGGTGVQLRTATGGVDTTLETGPTSVYSLAYSPSGDILAAGLLTGLELWDRRRRQRIGTLPGIGDTPGSLAFSPDGRLLAGGSSLQGKVGLWDVPQRTLIASFPSQAGGNCRVAFRPDGKALAVGAGDSVAMVDVESRTEIARLTAQHGSVHSLAYRPLKGSLAVGYQDGTVALWDTEARRITTSFSIPVPADRMAVNLVAVNRAGDMLAAAYGSSGVTVFNPDTGGSTKIAETQNGPTSLAFTLDDYFVVANEAKSKTVNMWYLVRTSV
ncbi:serine/threonine-protein kinase [Yinghuangia seranimata]|nr:serine/threonine-protein kinase [Yinghuangia seranimata]MDI2125209.1 serine/threonine-protein kinase [Yinghuangia seranimata]